jgi:hypothetical protein
MNSFVNHQSEQLDTDFNIEEVEQVIAPDINDVPDPTKATTSIISLCHCN